VRAAEHGRSVEAEIRAILVDAVAEQPAGLFDALRAISLEHGVSTLTFAGSDGGSARLISHDHPRHGCHQRAHEGKTRADGDGVACVPAPRPSCSRRWSLSPRSATGWRGFLKGVDADSPTQGGHQDAGHIDVGNDVGLSYALDAAVAVEVLALSKEVARDC
jgi:plasmid stability protein